MSRLKIEIDRLFSGVAFRPIPNASGKGEYVAYEGELQHGGKIYKVGRTNRGKKYIEPLDLLALMNALGY
ncbi:hypothetical protein GCM10023184_17560 [Flaviaesturariibacter amylovorans]|uniref:Uncharacterized protein n=1 Tax=Flaviaesturariibacter amylovorans TaxID=1084520 RepID=A0ABP8GPF3_9BACT